MPILPIYMDNHATTPLDARVLDAMMPYLTSEFGNPSSTDHIHGARAAEAVEIARERVAKTINASEQEIIFTSGATESDNLAIQGIAKAYSNKGKHIITCVTEHRAIIDSCVFLERNGWSVTYIPVDEFGTVDLQRLEDSVRPDTVLISIMFANNEIGTIAPVSDIGRIARDHGVLFHTDAAQAVGHIPVDVQAENIDLMSISGHKMYGPKGVGALYVRGHKPRVKPSPVVYGGGQERGLRSGTLNVPGIVGLGAAVEMSLREMKEEAGRLVTFRDAMRFNFESKLNARLNGHPTNRLPHNLNIFIPNVESKALIQSVKRIVSISSSSACTTDEVEPSHVIMALGFPSERAHCSIRLGLGRFTTSEEISLVTETIGEAAIRLTRLTSPQLALN